MTTTNGLLLVDKPRGLTSHDVVARVRKIIGERRVGHAGTLDPMATGLLVLAIGPSTRLLRFAQSEVKRYVGTVRLGVATDSLDADGAVVEQCPVPALTQAQMNDAAASMIGTQSQVPPMVSALKVGGRRLHELARSGVEVEREPREITVYAFSLTPGAEDDEWDFDVQCSVGTYVRVLLADLAVKVGTVGHLTRLRRTQSGSFDVARALTLDQFADEVASGAVVLAPPSAFVASLEHVELSEDAERKMRMGQRIELDEVFSTSEIAAMNRRGELAGILGRRGDSWQPELVLPDEGPHTRG